MNDELQNKAGQLPGPVEKLAWIVPELKEYSKVLEKTQGGPKLNIEGSSYHS